MTNVMSMALVSNGAMTPDVARGPNVRYVAEAKATVVPTATRVSMLPARALRAPQAPL